MGHDAGNELVCQLDEQSRVLLVGLGGIGSALLPPLALFLHSLELPLRLILVDGDHVRRCGTRLARRFTDWATRRRSRPPRRWRYSEAAT